MTTVLLPRASARPAMRLDAEKLRLGALFIMMLGSGLVFAEPSPYEIGALLAVGTFAATGGFRVNRALLPLIFLLIIYCLGLSAGAIQVLREPKVLSWVAVSWYLAVTMIFFAIVAAENTEARLAILTRGWTVAAIIAALAGLAGYFRAFSGAFDLFTLYGRAKGTFNDPNVFGPFLVFPMLMALQAFYRGDRGMMVRGAAVLAVTVPAMLLSFSRGAWIHFGLSAALMTALMMLTVTGRGARLRILAVVALGVVLLAGALTVLLSIDAVGDLMKQRANFNQSYDSGPMGRFGRHVYGWQMAMDLPMGIGPLQFSKFFVEDVHNVYLNAFLSGGWVAGIAYHVIIGLTLLVGVVASLQKAAWQPVTIAIFATFAGVAFEGKIIDTDHWRHFWVLAGLLWGLAIANRVAARRERL